MPDTLKGKKVAILATDGVEQVEFTKPRDALLAAGATVDTLSIKSGSIQGFNHLDKGDTFPVDLEVSDAARTTTTRWCCRVASRTPTRCAWTRTR